MIKKKEEFFNKFSEREKEVIRLIAQGKSNKQIASELCLTEGTVKHYVHNILTKGDLKNRREIIIIMHQ